MMAPVIRGLLRPFPISWKTIEEMFRISTPGNSRSGYFFNKKFSLIVGVCEDLEVNLMHNSFGKARMSMRRRMLRIRSRKRSTGMRFGCVHTGWCQSISAAGRCQSFQRCRRHRGQRRGRSYNRTFCGCWHVLRAACWGRRPRQSRGGCITFILHE